MGAACVDTSRESMYISKLVIKNNDGGPCIWRLHNLQKASTLREEAGSVAEDRS